MPVFIGFGLSEFGPIKSVRILDCVSPILSPLLTLGPGSGVLKLIAKSNVDESGMGFIPVVAPKLLEC